MNNGEIAILIMLGIDLLLNSYLHGRTKEGRYNFWINLINVAIWILLLKWAGLF